jgi:hypothetical protein
MKLMLASETILQKALFSPRKGKMGDYRIYVLLAPHLGNKGSRCKVFGDDTFNWAREYWIVLIVSEKRLTSMALFSCNLISGNFHRKADNL